MHDDFISIYAQMKSLGLIEYTYDTADNPPRLIFDGTLTKKGLLFIRDNTLANKIDLSTLPD